MTHSLHEFSVNHNGHTAHIVGADHSKIQEKEAVGELASINNIRGILPLIASYTSPLFLEYLPIDIIHQNRHRLFTGPFVRQDAIKSEFCYLSAYAGMQDRKLATAEPAVTAIFLLHALSDAIVSRKVSFNVVGNTITVDPRERTTMSANGGRHYITASGIMQTIDMLQSDVELVTPVAHAARVADCIYIASDPTFQDIYQQMLEKYRKKYLAAVRIYEPILSPLAYKIDMFPFNPISCSLREITKATIDGIFDEFISMINAYIKAPTRSIGDERHQQDLSKLIKSKIRNKSDKADIIFSSKSTTYAKGWQLSESRQI